MSKTQAQTLDELQNMFQQYIKDKGFLYADNKYRCNKDEKIYMDNDTCERSIVADFYLGCCSIVHFLLYLHRS